MKKYKLMIFAVIAVLPVLALSGCRQKTEAANADAETSAQAIKETEPVTQALDVAENPKIEESTEPSDEKSSDTDHIVPDKGGMMRLPSVYERLNTVYTTPPDAELMTISHRFYLVDGHLMLERHWFYRGEFYTYDAAEVFPDDPEIMFLKTDGDISFPATIRRFSGFSRAGNYWLPEEKAVISLEGEALIFTFDDDQITTLPDKEIHSLHNEDAFPIDMFPGASKPDGTYTGCWSAVGEDETGAAVSRYLSFKEDTQFTVQEKTDGMPVKTYFGSYAMNPDGNVITLTERLGYGGEPHEGEFTCRMEGDKLLVTDVNGTYFPAGEEIAFTSCDSNPEVRGMCPKDTADTGSELEQASLLILSTDCYSMQDGKIWIRCQNLTTEEDSVYAIDSNTVFTGDCEREGFADLHDNESPYEWFSRIYEIVSADDFDEGTDGITFTALAGILEVKRSENYIKEVLGFYWWD